MLACDGQGCVVESPRAAPRCPGRADRSQYKDPEGSHAKADALKNTGMVGVPIYAAGIVA
jgi:hypothetical protein